MEFGRSGGYRALRDNDASNEHASEDGGVNEIAQPSIFEQARENDISQRSDALELQQSSVTLSSSNAAKKTEERKTVEEVIDMIGFGKFHFGLLAAIGFAIIADSMEILTLTILAPALHCDMHLRSFDQALLTSVVFGGMLLGAPAFGSFCDRFGRKPCLVFYPILTGYFGILCSLAPRFEWILILRCLVGFGVGGSVQLTTYMSELLPTRWRAKSIVIVSLFGALGSLCQSLLALAIMPILGWRFLLAFSGIPILSFAYIATKLPESPRYLLINGREEDARNVLRSVARTNAMNFEIPRLTLDVAATVITAEIRTESDAGTSYNPLSDEAEQALVSAAEHNDHERLIVDKQEASDGSCSCELLSPVLRRTTLTLWCIWLMTAFAYYGVVLLTTEVLATEGTCSSGFRNSDSSKRYSDECYVTCQSLSTADYVSLSLTSASELLSVVVTFLVIDWIGRKRTFAIAAFSYCVAMLLLNLCVHRLGATVVLFFARASVASAVQTVYVYAPEVYPTTVRAVGLGACSSFARLGAVLTPLIAQVLTKSSLSAASCLYAIAGLLNCALGLSLPLETRGRPIVDAVRPQNAL